MISFMLSNINWALTQQWLSHVSTKYWADDKQSKARNSDSKYRQMALVGFDT